MVMIRAFPWSHGHDPGKLELIYDPMIVILKNLWSHDHDPNIFMILWSWSWDFHDPMIMILDLCEFTMIRDGSPWIVSSAYKLLEDHQQQILEKNSF